jgi:transcriptional regulator of acetoin/glycerol metabolism
VARAAGAGRAGGAAAAASAGSTPNSHPAGHAAEPGARLPSAAGEPSSAGQDRDGWSLAEVEKEHIRRVLDRHRGNATAAARQLGISRTTLWRKLREYGLTRRSR